MQVREQLRLFYVMANDWCALYCNGEIYDQNHSLHWPWLLEMLVGKGDIISFQRAELIDAGEAWLEELGSFPDTESEIPVEGLYK